jgi:hypothetical protein
LFLLFSVTDSNDALGIDDSGDNNVGDDGNKGDNDVEGNDNTEVHTVDDNHGRSVVGFGVEFVEVPDSSTLFSPFIEANSYYSTTKNRVLVQINRA